MDKENVLHIDNGVLFSHTKEQNYVISGKLMELGIIMLSEIRLTQKDKYHIFSHVCKLDLNKK
jgi:hypothetical protein